MKKAIFVGGVHRVGKTTFANDLSERLVVNFYNCGSIIASMKKGFFEEGDKRVPNVEQAQQLLIKGLEERVHDEKYILDGHFCVINADNVIEVIPIDVFQKLNIVSIIVVTRDPKEIAKSIELKDREKYGVRFIELFQNIEIEYAKYIAKELNVPIIVCDADEKPEIEF